MQADMRSRWADAAGMGLPKEEREERGEKVENMLVTRVDFPLSSSDPTCGRHEASPARSASVMGVLGANNVICVVVVRVGEHYSNFARYVQAD